MLSNGIKGCRRGIISISVIEMMMVVYTQELCFYLGSMLVMDEFSGFKNVDTGGDFCRTVVNQRKSWGCYPSTKVAFLIVTFLKK